MRQSSQCFASGFSRGKRCQQICLWNLTSSSGVNSASGPSSSAGNGTPIFLAASMSPGPMADEAQRGQVRDQLAIEGGLELEVEVRHGAPEREAGEAQAGRQLAVGGGRGLFADDPGQELDVAPFLVLGLFGQGGEALGRAPEPR